MADFKSQLAGFLFVRSLANAYPPPEYDGPRLRRAVITPKCEELLVIIMIERCNIMCKGTEPRGVCRP